MKKATKNLREYYKNNIGKKKTDEKKVTPKNRFSGEYEKYQESSDSKPFKG